VIRVLLADDQALVREGLRLILDAQPDITVVAEAATGDDAVRAARSLHPDVVVMDIQMPGMDGITATGRLLDAADWPVRVIVVTTFDLDEYVYRALRLGASGFLLKTAPPRLLPIAVREVHAGETMLSSQLTRRLIEQFTFIPSIGPGDVPAAFAALTPRELDVLRLIARGHTNAQIAAELVVTEATVKTHVVRILAKLALHDRTQAAVAAYEHGLVTPSSSQTVELATRRLPRT
jgi:DNA-binding NarL/FixJ family response regulator